MRTLSFILLSFLICSCAATRVKVNTIYTNGITFDTLSLVSTAIGPVWQPVLPLIDAAAFNAKTNDIADQIMDVEEKAIPAYKTILVNELKMLKPVSTGANISNEAADKYRVNSSLQIDNKNFPVVFFSKGDLNIIDYGNGKNVNSIFKNDQSLKARIAKFATELKLKTVVISYNRLCVVSAGMFGSNGNLRLETYLFFYNAQGNLMMDVYGWYKPTNISGKKLEEYRYQLDNFKELSMLMTQELKKYVR